MLEFFRSVAQSIPSRSPSPSAAGQQQQQQQQQLDQESGTSTLPDSQGNGSSGGGGGGSSSTTTGTTTTTRDMLQDRAGIIVLREDLDFYVIPPRADIDPAEMMEVKRAANRALIEQSGIFSGLRKSEESGTTEQHLIEMLTAG
jgi:pectate lyase